MHVQYEHTPHTPLLHTHAHNKVHHRAETRARRALLGATLFTSLFMLLELAGGWFAASLAIMTDAAHLVCYNSTHTTKLTQQLTDIAAMLLSLFAMWLARRPATAQLTFGYHRAEILGALVT